MVEERKRILKMVEQGKLTVDEALTLIEELDKSSKAMEEKQEQWVTELSTVVKSEEQKQKSEYKSQDTFQSTKEKFFDFVDSAVKKIKEFDLDLNFGKHAEVSHIFQQTEADIKYMDIDIANGHVSIIPWDQKDIRVECEAQVYKGESQEEAKEYFLKEITFEVRGQRLYFTTGQKSIKLKAKVYIPQQEYDQFDIRMFNGSIEGKELNVKQTKIKTAIGKITIDHIRSEEVEAETANGGIQFIGSQIGKLEAETLNGGIQVEGDFRKLELQSFNGDISAQILGATCEWLEATTTTGAIECVIPEPYSVNGDLKSNLGNFTVDLDGIQIVEEKNELIQKNLGFKSIQESSHPLRLFAETKTGSIAVRKA
ncbi:DUF4097 family beta strand repeat-containing protein [Niallia sp. Krafla_26]|uniref:DUF4097 family beta strand repeat-containing protein n=1 Tax=Niallia sp. Krafla_26 TaxID=3064703 RepID=UPI003D180612